jgi:hypothetical protein
MEDIGNKRIVIEIPADLKADVDKRVEFLNKKRKVLTMKDYFMQLIKKDLNGSGIL